MTRREFPPVPPPPFEPAAAERWMRRALELARSAEAAGDVPVGAVIVGADGAVLGEGFNEREATGDPTAHAELLAIRRAAARVGRWRLDGATLYVTLEPCPMCAGAVACARLPRVVYGADDPKAGALGSRYAVGIDGRWNHVAVVERGVLAAECGALLTAFFARRR